jgi:hypothetical protein
MTTLQLLAGYRRKNTEERTTSVRQKSMDNYELKDN